MSEFWHTIRVLERIAEAGDQMPVDAIKDLYGTFGRGAGQTFNHRIIRPGLAEWVRSPHRQRAVAVRLTDVGRKALRINSSEAKDR